MARETKAERERREAMLKAARLTEEVTTYQDRLIALLERATKTGFDLRVENKMFVLTFDQFGNQHLSVDLDPIRESETSEFLYQDALDAVERVDQRRAEELRRYNLRQDALAKLSKEEREVLGLLT